MKNIIITFLQFIVVFLLIEAVENMNGNETRNEDLDAQGALLKRIYYYLDVTPDYHVLL